MLLGSLLPVGAAAADPIEDLRQALRIPIRDSTNKEELQARKALLEKRASLLTIGDLRRALLLTEWRDEDRDEAIAAIDRDVKRQVATRLIDSLKGLMERGNTPARLAAIIQVGEMGVVVRTAGGGGLARELTPELIAQMKSGEPMLRESAARALGRINADPKPAAAALGQLLKDGNVGERRAAGDGLNWMLRTVVQATKQVKDVQAVAMPREEQAAIATAVVPQAGRGLEDADYRVRRYCIESIQLAALILSDLTPDPSGPPFLLIGRKPTKMELEEIERYREDVEAERKLQLPLARALAAQSAGLGRRLSDSDAELRFLAAQALEEMGMARLRMLRKVNSVPPLPAPDKPEKDSRRPSAPGKPAILLTSAERVALVQDKDKGPDSLTEDPFKPGLVADAALLAARLGDPNERVRIAAVDALELLGSDAAGVVPQLVRGLSDRSPFVRWATVRTLGRIGPVDTERTVPLIAELLCDHDLDVRLAAAYTLGSYGDKSAPAVAQLAKAVVSGDAEQRIAAMKALQSIGKDAAPAVPALAQALGFADERVRRAAPPVLGLLGAAARSAIPALQQALFDSDPLVRQAASDALLSITAGK